MQKVLKIVNKNEPQSDFVFWKTKTELERLEAIEFLRKQYLSLQNNVHERLQRVCTITHKK